MWSDLFRKDKPDKWWWTASEPVGLFLVGLFVVMGIIGTISLL